MYKEECVETQDSKHLFAASDWKICFGVLGSQISYYQGRIREATSIKTDDTGTDRTTGIHRNSYLEIL